VRKSAFVFAAALISSFAMGRAQSLIAHQGFVGPVACAQQWDDSMSDDAANAQPDTVPNVAGSYSGTLEDHRFGMGDITADIVQNGSKLSGNWSSDFGGPGTIKGSVKASGAVKARLKIKGGCGVSIKGVFQGGDEIVGTYKVTGCGKSDGGTFDMFD